MPDRYANQFNYIYDKNRRIYGGMVAGIRSLMCGTLTYCHIVRTKWFCNIRTSWYRCFCQMICNLNYRLNLNLAVAYTENQIKCYLISILLRKPLCNWFLQEIFCITARVHFDLAVVSAYPSAFPYEIRSLAKSFPIVHKVAVIVLNRSIIRFCILILFACIQVAALFSDII